MNVSAILDAAADRVKQFGWWSLHYADNYTTSRCAANHVSDAAGDHYGAAHIALAQAISPRGGCCAIFQWNDTPGRTAAEVIAMLRACAAVERARESTDAAISQPVQPESAKPAVVSQVTQAVSA